MQPFIEIGIFIVLFWLVVRYGPKLWGRSMSKEEYAEWCRNDLERAKSIDYTDSRNWTGLE